MQNGIAALGLWWHMHASSTESQRSGQITTIDVPLRSRHDEQVVWEAAAARGDSTCDVLSLCAVGHGGNKSTATHWAVREEICGRMWGILVTDWAWPCVPRVPVK